MLVVGDSAVDESWPANSPDGKQIVHNVAGAGIFIVGATGESPRRLTSVGVQPSWSPDGTQIVYATGEAGSAYYIQGGIALEIATVRGGAPRALNVILPTGGTGRQQPSWSQSGARIAFLGIVHGVRDIYTVATAGEAAVSLMHDGVSPDGQWLLLVNAPDRHQDVFLMRSNGRDLSRLTDDDARDREARFIGRGDSVIFRSNASGTYDAWSIRRDGGNRTRLTEFPEGVFGPVFSPDGSRLALSSFPTGDQDQTVRIGGPSWPMTRATSTAAVGVTVGTATPGVYSWSRNGRWQSGALFEPSGAITGHALYDVAAGKLRQLDNEAVSGELAFLPGDRQVVYFNTHGALIMQDIESLQRWVIGDSLPYAAAMPKSIVVSPDGCM